MVDLEYCCQLLVALMNLELHGKVNGENLTVFQSWKTGVDEYIQRHLEQFELLWNGKHKDYLTFNLPKAVAEKLPQKFYRSQRPKYDPYEDPNTTTEIDRISRLILSAQLMLQICNVKGLAHLGLGPVVVVAAVVDTVSVLLVCVFESLQHYTEYLLQSVLVYYKFQQ